MDIHCHGGLFLYPWGDDESQSIDSNQNFRNTTYDGLRGNIEDATYREYIPIDLEAKLRNVADRMNKSLETVQRVDYKVQQSVGLYPISGTSDDYAFSRQNELNLPILY